MDKPLLIFDGDCGFCRHWVTRWKHLTKGRVDYLPFQDHAIRQWPPPALRLSSLKGTSERVGIQPPDFSKAVHLLEPDGIITHGAEAVFRTLEYADIHGWMWVYRHVPGFSALSEFVYEIVAGHRPTFSTLTRWIWGSPEVRPSQRLTAWLFLRGLAVVYGVAFWSFGRQVQGLIGSQGILPAREFLDHLSTYGVSKFWFVPTIAWLNASDHALGLYCAAGLVFAVLLFLNMAPRVALAALWVLYLSITSVGGDFMNFQWEALLLETGFLAFWLAPPGLLPQVGGAPSPPRPILFLLKWLLFRLMIESDIVKWASHDPLWRHLTALSVHYETQPLPNPLSWFAHQWPMSVQKACCAGMFFAEGFVPFLIFAPRRARLASFWALAGFQIALMLTGNFAYFNLLTLVLCVPLLDDAALRRVLPWRLAEPPHFPRPGWLAPVRKVGLPALTVSVLFLTSVSLGRTMGWVFPRPLLLPGQILSPLRSFNSYGLFAVMTPTRPEIILQGSYEGRVWQDYGFKYKPGALDLRPKQIAPFQPRLDWQMWFAALGDYRQNPWFLRLVQKLLEGSQPVLELLGENPFSEKPPRYIRGVLYEYRFTTPAERRSTGNWWAREFKGLYSPNLSLNKPAS